jgi:hypothetical protein
MGLQLFQSIGAGQVEQTLFLSPLGTRERRSLAALCSSVGLGSRNRKGLGLFFACISCVFRGYWRYLLPWTVYNAAETRPENVFA